MMAIQAMENNKFRDDLSSEQRSIDLRLKIDPGFVHHRKIQTIIGQEGLRIINNLISDIPDSMPEWSKNVHIDQIYSDLVLRYCEVMKVPSLNEILYSQNGRLFCSTHRTLACENLYEVERGKIEIDINGSSDKKVFLELSTSRISGSTLHSRLRSGGEYISIVGQFFKMTQDEIIFEPLILGFPWLEDDNHKADFDTMWHHYDFYENFIEDFNEFSNVKSIPIPDDFSILKNISENVIKEAFAKIINENTSKDWGGETSDLFTTHIHLNKKRLKAAFLLKGPANFKPMGLNHLGKNNDQIVRLSKEPADLFIVQHCHDILQPVRETLRAFSVQPGRPRRYCLIDGRDTLRVLKAYDMLDWALEKMTNNNNH